MAFTYLATGILLEFVLSFLLATVPLGLPTNYAAIHCNENPIYAFLFWELRGLSPDFHIHVSVRDLYIPRIGHIVPYSKIDRPILGIYKSLTDT